MFLKDRMMAEQVDKEAIESVLQGDLKDARDQIGKLSVLLVISHPCFIQPVRTFFPVGTG